MKTDHIKAIVESLLFASGVPLPLRRLVEVTGATKAPSIPALTEGYGSEKWRAAISSGRLPTMPTMSKP